MAAEVTAYTRHPEICRRTQIETWSIAPEFDQISTLTR